MNKEYDPLDGGNYLPAFHRWARSKGLNYNLSYSEAEHVWEVTLTSAAPAEGAYLKRCHNLRHAIEYWNYTHAIHEDPPPENSR